MNSPILPPVLSPPQRPNKSRLRTLSAIDQSTHSETGSTSSSSNHSSMSPPEKSRYRANRSKEDDALSDIINEFSLPPAASPPPPLSILRTGSLKTSKSLTSMPSPTSKKSTDESPMRVEFNLPATGTTVVFPSISTPLQLPPKKASTFTGAPRKYSSNGSILSTTPGHTKHHHLTAGSLNRADVILGRLEGWHLFLKSVVGWLEETSKINLASSRGYAQRAYGYLDESSDIAAIKKGFLVGETDEKANQFVLTVQAGLHAITMQLAAEQQDVSHTIDRHHLPALLALRKQVKDKIHTLKNDPALLLDDLLRRAEITRSKMAILSRCCKQTDQHADQVDMDPWLANALVMHHLKREVEEENRLRLLLVPIQKEAHDFEQRVIHAVKPAVEYCYQKIGPVGSTPPLLMPLGDWDQFVHLNERDLVNEKTPTKDHHKIKYPNKFHSAVNTLLKGNLQRKAGSRKQFLERYYVLTQGGYLHEFSSETPLLAPERTFYIPSTTVIPSIDINQLTTTEEESDLTFEICKPSTNILQKDKVSLFKANTRQELVEWCSLLIQVSTGMPVETPPLQAPPSPPLQNDVEVKHSPLEDNESGVIDDYFSKPL